MGLDTATAINNAYSLSAFIACVAGSNEQDFRQSLDLDARMAIADEQDQQVNQDVEALSKRRRRRAMAFKRRIDNGKKLRRKQSYAGRARDLLLLDRAREAEYQLSPHTREVVIDVIDVLGGIAQPWHRVDVRRAIAWAALTVRVTEANVPWVRIASSVGPMAICACVSSVSPTAAMNDESAPPWEDPERVCSLSDSQQAMGKIALTPEVHSGVREPHEGLRVLVRLDPQLHTSVSWARARSEGHWSPTSWTNTKLRADLMHSGANALQITFVPFMYAHPQTVGIWLTRTPSGEVLADLDITRKIPFEDLLFVSDVRGSVTMSSLDWAVGDELVIHVEVGQYPMYCGDLRFRVPPVGQHAPALPPGGVR